MIWRKSCDTFETHAFDGCLKAWFLHGGFPGLKWNPKTFLSVLAGGFTIPFHNALRLLNGELSNECLESALTMGWGLTSEAVQVAITYFWNTSYLRPTHSLRLLKDWQPLSMFKQQMVAGEFALELSSCLFFK